LGGESRRKAEDEAGSDGRSRLRPYNLRGGERAPYYGLTRLAAMRYPRRSAALCHMVSAKKAAPAAQEAETVVGRIAMTNGAGGEGAMPRKTRILVFVHGSGDSERVWEPLVTRLPEYECMALDLPGHGALVDRPGPVDMRVDDYAAAVHAELARRGLAGVCLVGHSLGSAIALRMALDYPSQVNRLALIGGGARLRVLPALLDEARTSPETAKEKLTRLAFAPTNETRAPAQIAAMGPLAPGMLARDLSACDAFDMMGDLGRVAQPTLVVVGEEDRLTPPKYAAYLRDSLADARLVTVPGAGHYVALEAPDAVADALRRWLESNT
ncbi:MAG: alpha/beta fold hydrolase, partial [Ktedonobacterales bacterium]